MVHDPGYSSAGHYMAILDINKDKTQIYVSNPDSNNNIQNGWNPISVFYTGGQSLTDCYFVSNKGSVTAYSGNSSSDSGVSDTTCTGTESGKYYTTLKKTDGLNRIDFMNSNPDIFHRYIRDGAEYYNYVGYSRSKLALSYWNLKKLFKDVAEKNDGILPWAYGKTLGFDNVYTTKLSSTSTAGGGIFIWPIPKYVEQGLTMWQQITSTFGNRTHPITGQPGTMHNGIDISAGGTPPIVAAASGKVVKASDSGDGYGNCVIIQHSDGYYTLYGHMSSLNVTVGENVSQGQQIGIMGTTGNSTGNHLHFEIEKFDGDFSMAKYYTNERLDPVNFFNDDCSSIGGASGLNLTNDQIKDFAIMVKGEAGSHSYELQVACAAAAISQYKAAKAEGKDVDMLEDFVHNPSNFNGYADEKARGTTIAEISENDSWYKAAVAALNGEDPTGGALYFYAPAAMVPPGSISPWHESLNYLCTIDGVRFFKP